MIAMGMCDETGGDLPQIIIKGFLDFMEADTGLDNEDFE